MAGHGCGKYADNWRTYAGIFRFNPFSLFMNMAKKKELVMRLFGGGLGNQLFQYAFLFRTLPARGKSKVGSLII